MIPARFLTLSLLGLAAVFSAACAQESSSTRQPDTAMTDIPANAQQAIFAGGCFWCTEAVFERINGVLRVESGYIGGTVPNPTYQQVCTGTTGHAEAIRVTFDPDQVSYAQLVGLFFVAHDPTTLNRQGADTGTQYRSAIFTLDAAQQATAEKVKAELDASGEFSKPIVTEITPATTFYPAEGYHQDYYDRNSSAPYCQVVIAPKLKKLGLE
jgi:peptide-methionine (S)-S-oxide reductase